MAIKNHAVINGQLQAHQSLNGKITESFLKGDKGDSAYEVAVEHGFVGTEEEWLASLIGPEGQQGIQGIPGEKGDPGDDYVLTEADKEEIASLATVKDVKINSISILDEGVANIPFASNVNAGVVKVISSYGLQVTNGNIATLKAEDTDCANGSSNFKPIVPSKQHSSVFYGLAKAAGDTTQFTSSNPVGTYTEEAKTAIRSMLDVPSVDDIPEVPVQDVQINGTSIVNNGVANIPVSSTSNFGVAKTNTTNGVYTDANGVLTLSDATDLSLRLGNNTKYAVNTARQHAAAFYGLAKAAGDTTQSAASSNPVGTYTDEAKAAIKNMLGVREVQTVTVSGTDPVITAVDNTRYVCGEVTSLSFTPCASGICDVIFTSGSTVAVLTLPNTVKMPDGFEVEANTTYEINILDGVYGSVMSWT